MVLRTRSGREPRTLDGAAHRAHGHRTDRRSAPRTGREARRLRRGARSSAR